jgi:hypothetical protein
MQQCAIEKIEFAKLLVSRPIDPLAAAWLSLNCQCCDYHASTYACKLEQIRDDALIHPNMIIRIFRAGKLNECAPMGFDTRGVMLGLWTTERTRPHPYFTRNQMIYSTFTRSNDFIERVATYAFMCMYKCMNTGRDIAGMIARMVATIYLDDYEWIANLPPFINFDGLIEKEIRERITRWHAI